MRFDLLEKNGFVPNLEYGNEGQEHSCFIPDGIPWLQLSYGQGEGQVSILDCEWGFYYGDNKVISIELHDGTV